MSIVISDLLNRCTFPEGPLECAVSGGADSMALLVLATQVSSEVKAIHVDHGKKILMQKQISYSKPHNHSERLLNL